jgi:UDP-glucuronate decarboxylase
MRPDRQLRDRVRTASLSLLSPGGTMIDRKLILVTGGAGFLGSHLCDRLLADGHDVICVDNFFTGRKQNVEHLTGHPHFELMRHDVTFPLYVEVDEVYNLACPASPVHYGYDPIQTTKTSVLGAINMLGLAKRLKCRIFQASTSEVYGDPSVHPQTEGYWGNVNPIGPRACYDEGKRCAETLFFDYHRRHNVEVKVARIFNTYGPRMDPKDGRVVSNFIVHALKGQPITIYGDGSQTRSFCYVDDLIDAFVLFMESPADVTGPMNLGNPGEFTIKELAELVLELTGSKSKLAYLPLPQDDPKQRRPDITLAQERLGWQPTVALREGLLRTIVHFDRLLSGAELRVNGAAISDKPRRLAVANGRHVPSRLGQGEAADPTP